VRRLLIGIAALVVIAGVAAGAWYYHDQTRTREKRGSTTEEFVPSAPVVPKRPPKSIETVPWPLYGYDAARTRDAPFHVRPPFRQIWTVRVGNNIEFPPVIGYGLVYVNQLRGRLYAIHADTGRRAWRRYFQHCAAASPAVGKNVVYVAYMQAYPCNRYPRTQPGFVVALLVRSKRGVILGYSKVLWRFSSGAVESSPLLVNGILYFGSWNHTVYALDVRRDAAAVKAWPRRSRRFRPRLLWTFHADGEVNSSPAYSGGLVYFGTDSGSVYAVNARTGHERWRAQSYSRFGRREYFYATPTLAYGRVYIGNTDGTLYAFGARTGHLLWASHAGSYVYSAAAVWRRRVFIGTYDGKFLAYDAGTGAQIWSYDAPASVHGAPTVIDGLVYFSTCPSCGSHGSRSAKSGPRGTYALDARTGRLVWRFRDGQYSPVVADPERLYVVGHTRVYGFLPKNAPRHKKKKP
jgi:outer membrane protein assembly factor BamB